MFQNSTEGKSSFRAAEPGHAPSNKPVLIAVLLAIILVGSAFAVGLATKGSGPVNVDTGLPVDHENVPHYCNQGYLANHHCVQTCPTGFAPGQWFIQSPPSQYSGSPCMSADGMPYSTYDLVGLQVSPDNGISTYSVISDVPLEKVPVTGDLARAYWTLKVSQLSLAELVTLPIVPLVRTEVVGIGDQAASLLILSINPDSVTGDLSTFYPIGWCCRTVTIHIGDDVGVSCRGLSEILTSIDYAARLAHFTVHQTQGGSCPICLSGDTNIATPTGYVNVKDLKVGITVWTMDQYGMRVAAPIIKVGSIAVPITHQMVHLVLADGRQLYASPGHPTTDGRTLGQLKVSDVYDGSTVTIAQLTPYNQAYTYDLLPSGPTGFYWANGMLIASTLG